MNKKQFNYIQKKIKDYQEKVSLYQAYNLVEANSYRGKISSLQSLLEVMKGGEENE